MTTRVEMLRGLDRVDATTSLLQRARLAHPSAGIWEAADIQWWWRRPRSTDEIALPLWFDALGPVGAVALTDWGGSWQGDALVVPDTVDLHVVWSALLDAADRADVPSLEVLARDDDDDLLALLADDRFAATDERSGITWMSVASRPPTASVPDGYSLVARASRPGRPHPLRARNGDDVEARLRECSLYDPELDLSVETSDGDTAGYALFWFDDVTKVGMLEPMRVEDGHQRRGLARALLSAGLDRLAGRGAHRFKVAFGTAAAHDLYVDAGFSVTSTVRSFRRRRSLQQDR